MTLQVLLSNVLSFLNTLAQTGTEKARIVNGNGTELSNEKAIKGRAKRKMITDRMTLSLIDVVKKKEDFGRLQGYWNTYHCQSRIYTADGQIYGRYARTEIACYA